MEKKYLDYNSFKREKSHWKGKRNGSIYSDFPLEVAQTIIYFLEDSAKSRFIQYWAQYIYFWFLPTSTYYLFGVLNENFPITFFFDVLNLTLDPDLLIHKRTEKPRVIPVDELEEIPKVRNALYIINVWFT